MLTHCLGNESLDSQLKKKIPNQTKTTIVIKKQTNKQTKPQVLLGCKKRESTSYM